MRESPQSHRRDHDGVDHPGTKCPLCGHDRFALLHDGSFRVLLCRGCALVFLTGPQRDLDDYYRHHYEYGLEDHPTSHDRIVRWIVQHLPPTIERRVLEIGCGRGHLLVRLRERGFRVSGVEPGRRAAEHARDANGLTVACSTVEGLVGPVREERYDAVLMIQTLEHLANPLGALSKVRDLLATGALLFVEVPHYFSPNGLYRWRVDGRYEPSPNHLFVYSSETLTAFLTRAGFEVVERTRTLNDLRIVARPSSGPRAADWPPRPAGAYWRARAFHGITPLLLRAVDAAKRVRRTARRVRA